jgi:hypothetical protein
MANAILPGRKKLWQSSMTTRRSAWSVLSGAWKFTQSALHTRSTTGMEVGTRALLMQWMNSLENMGTRSPSTASAKRFGKAQTLQAAWKSSLPPQPLIWKSQQLVWKSHQLIWKSQPVDLEKSRGQPNEFNA